MYVIKINHDNCVMCRYCEIVCSFALSGKYDPDRSVIKEIKTKKHGIDVLECNRCKNEPKCAKACEYRALTYERVKSEKDSTKTF